ncbi:MAG: VOC family protein [Betaproteobacteria bacterium]|jgi:catechol 2,3-dioxygenase-like lactoylglutathione lyase family enzyme|nr:VOC family protein [Betaproteobacteria bacterium]
MPVSHLEHFLIQTDDIERTCDWYVRVLGFRIGPSPDFRFPVKWLYLGDRDVIHVCEGGAAVSEARRRYLGQQSEDLRGSGVIDHVAFRCSGLQEMLARLKNAGVEFNERQVDDQALYQVFLFDPNGVKVELNFAAAEATGRRAAVTAADLET